MAMRGWTSVCPLYIYTTNDEEKRTMNNDRVIVHTVAHSGGVMLDIQAANDDHPRAGGWLLEVDLDGNIGILFRNEDDCPFSLTLRAGGGVVIRESEELANGVGCLVRRENSASGDQFVGTFYGA